MVDTQEIRDAFAARLNAALDDVADVRVGRGRNVDFHALMKAKAPGFNSSKQATHKWLRAESMPEKDNMRMIARLTGVRAEWLEYGEGSMRADDQANTENKNSDKESNVTPGTLDSLLAAVTPRSRKVVERIIELERQGRLTAQDIDLIDSMVDRFSIKEK